MSEPCELYRLTEDPFEQNDVSAAHPEVVQELEEKWKHWGTQNKVFPLEPTPWRKRVNHYKEKNPDQDGVD